MDWVNTLPIVFVVGVVLAIFGHMVYQSWMARKEQK